MSTSDLCKVQQTIPHYHPHFLSSLPSFPAVPSGQPFFRPFLRPCQLDLTSSTAAATPPCGAGPAALSTRNARALTLPRLSGMTPSPCVAASPFLPPVYPTDPFQMPPLNFPPHFKLRNQFKTHLEYLNQLPRNPQRPISDPSSKPTPPVPFVIASCLLRQRAFFPRFPLPRQLPTHGSQNALISPRRSSRDTCGPRQKGPGLRPRR